VLELYSPVIYPKKGGKVPRTADMKLEKYLGKE
jgi:hypothetical protein